MRPKLTLEQINNMVWFTPAHKKMAIDYHINGNEYADYDYLIKSQPKEWVIETCTKWGSPIRAC